MRRLLLRQRLYGTKVGFVWVIYPDDLEIFKRLRRPPGRPRKTVSGTDKTALASIAMERSRAGTGQLLRQQRRVPADVRPRRPRRRSGTKRA